MITTINPTNVVPPVTTTGTGNNVNAAGNVNANDRGNFRVNVTNNNVNDLELFEELMAYESAQQLLQTPTAGQSTAATVDDTTVLEDATLLNLSPQALNVLNGIGGTVDATGNVTFTGSLGVSLTVQQQQQLAAIVAEFGNAPFDENTFAQIQAALVAAGIDPEQISLQEVLQGMLAVSSPYANLDSEVVTSELTSELLAA